MLNELKLKALLVMKEKSINDLSAIIGISTPTFYRKLNGKSDFTRNEIALIAKALDLSDNEITEIFFAEKVS